MDETKWSSNLYPDRILTFARWRILAPLAVRLTSATGTAQRDAAGWASVLDRSADRKVATHYGAVHFSVRVTAR